MKRFVLVLLSCPGPVSMVSSGLQAGTFPSPDFCSASIILSVSVILRLSLGTRNSRWWILVSIWYQVSVSSTAACVGGKQEQADKNN